MWPFDIPLRVWTKQNLSREDWNFTVLKEFPQEMLRLAWLCEVDRELGSGYPPYFVAWESHELKMRKAKLMAHLQGADRTPPESLSERDLRALLPEIPPDQSELSQAASLAKMQHDDMTPEESDIYREKELALHMARSRRLDAIARAEVTATTTAWKPPTPKEPISMLKSYRHHEFSRMQVPQYYTWVNGSASYHCTIHPLEIDWTLTETELVNAFRNWLREGDHAPFRSGYKRSAEESKVGKRKTAGWLAWLRDLAIYRISTAGFTSKQGLKMLGIQSMSAANWEHAQARTRERIAAEKKRCEHTAWDQGAGLPANWRNYLIRPFDL